MKACTLARSVILILVAFAPVLGRAAEPVLFAPWSVGEWWQPTTYDGHAGLGTRQALDLNMVDGNSVSDTWPFGTELNDAGRAIRAAHSGTVSLVDNGDTGYGKLVKITYDQDTSYVSYYAHLASFSVADGSQVNAGDQVGICGESGNAQGTHLHFELRHSNSRIDLIGVQFDGQAVNIDLSRTDSLGRYRGHPIKAIHGTPPGAPILESGTGFFAWRTTLSLTARNNGGTEPQDTYFRLSNGQSRGWGGDITWTVGPLEGGTYTWWAKKRNNYGGGWHEGPESSRQFQINCPPNIPIPTSPIGDHWVTSRSVTLVWPDPGDPDNLPMSYRNYSAQIRSEGGWNSGTNGDYFATTWTVTVPADDRYFWKVSAGDGMDGRGYSAEAAFRVDSVAPTVAIDSFVPASPSKATSVNFNVSATDSNSGVDRIELYAGADLVGTVNGASGTVTWNPTTEGTYTIRATAYDVAGNTATTETTYIVDRTGPATIAALSPGSPNGANGWYITHPTVTLSASDPSGIDRIFCDTGSGFVEGTSFVVASEGVVTVRYYSVDKAGNEGPIGETTVGIDTTPPLAGVLVDDGATTSSNQAFNVSLTGADDPESGLSWITYKVGRSPGDDCWRGETTVPAFGPFLTLEGLQVPDGENVVVTLKSTNWAGLAGDWLSTDGLTVDTLGMPYHELTRVWPAAGAMSQADDLVLEGTLGEVVLGVSWTDPADSIVRGGFMAPSPGFVTGAVALQDFVGDVTSVPLTVTVYAPGSATPIETHTVYLGSDNSFAFLTNLTGVYDISVKGSHWLRKRIANVVFNDGGAENLEFSLINGDVNGDNSINLADLTTISRAWRSRPGSSNWNANADLTGDNAVNLADFTIVSRNWRLFGDR